MGLVGESGSGKTACALSVMRLLPERARVMGVRCVRGTRVAALSEPEMRAVRARDREIFSGPMTFAHAGFSRSVADGEAVRLHRHTARRRNARAHVEALA